MCNSNVPQFMNEIKLDNMITPSSFVVYTNVKFAELINPHKAIGRKTIPFCFQCVYSTLPSELYLDVLPVFRSSSCVIESHGAVASNLAQDGF